MNDDSHLAPRRIRKIWTAKAPFWLAWADHMAPIAAKMNAPFLDAVGLAPGQTVLDLASGAGEPAFGAAERIGPTGRVVATDLVPDMLAGICRRATASGVSNIVTVAANAERLPFAPASFDRVTCRFGLMFIERVDRTLAEVRRVLKPGGRAGFMVWGPEEDNGLFKVIREALRTALGAVFDPADDAKFRFGRPGSARAAFAAAGLVNLVEEERRLLRNAPTDRPFWRANLEMSYGPQLATHDADERRRLDEAIRTGFERYREGDSFRLPVHIRILTGEAPG